MKNFQKLALGLVVAVMAIGFSAFTSAKNATIVTYYKTNLSTPANNPAGYQFYSSDRCQDGGSLCSSRWDIGSNPAPTVDGAALPSSGVTYQSGSTEPGHFQ
ncbi:hypothetical protein [Pedobacter sp. UYP1]|uniref:hypothetical protein n=1 Tax=Pedobacter sp. UYP1 TaxID=1756396 RepID=UPI003391EAAF